MKNRGLFASIYMHARLHATRLSTVACCRCQVRDEGLGQRRTMCGRLQHGAAGRLRMQRQLRPQHRRQRRAARLLAKYSKLMSTYICYAAF